MTKETTYKDSGVDIDKADAFVVKIKDHAKSTFNTQVLSGIGGFSGLFELDLKGYQNPVLVSSTDGVGTKLKIAIDANDVSGVGQDLVAMCVNDMICMGAKPLFFLDYIATSALDENLLEPLIASIAKALKSIDCALLGGETAEMPGFYHGKDFDVAGFCTGILEKSKILDNSKIKDGDVLIGLPSSGVHSNGFSLVRKILQKNNLSLNDHFEGSKESIGTELLKPTELYVNQTLQALENFDIEAIAHITGGGFTENLPRILPNQKGVEIFKNKVPVLPLFRNLQKLGNVPESEMWRVFNMGIGLVYVIAPEFAEDLRSFLKSINMPSYHIGNVIAQDGLKPKVFYHDN